jgi:hypothetical protein
MGARPAATGDVFAAMTPSAARSLLVGGCADGGRPGMAPRRL